MHRFKHIFLMVMVLGQNPISGSLIYNSLMTCKSCVRKVGVNVRTLKTNLIPFEIISGLKVNFHKSLLVGVNVEESWIPSC